MIALLAASSAAYADSMPTREEMWEMIQLQQKQIETLQKGQTVTHKKVEKAEKKVEARFS